MFVCVTVCYAQTKPEQEFETAIKLCEEEKFEEAVDAFSAFMRKYPKHELKGRAHYNLAFTYRSMGNLQKAKETFVAILDMNYNERDENTLMEPYALYKHHASRQLAMIALDEKAFDEAEKYIGYFDKKFPYQHFCGNEWAAYDIFKSIMDAKLHEGRKHRDLAVRALVPHMFYNGLARNDHALDELGGILERNFEPAAVREMFSKALASLRAAGKKESGYIITFHGVDVPISPYGFEFGDEGGRTIDDYRKMLRSHVLFLKYL